MIAERLTWAVELLDVQPGGRVLEIGCGTGVAAAQIAGRLKDGHITAIDRSAAMIRRACTQQAGLVAGGRVTFRCAALAAAGFSGERFDSIVAVNVNDFWRRPAASLAVVKTLLKPQGIVLLVFQPPTSVQSQQIAATVRRHLDEIGFSIRAELRRPIDNVTAVAFRAACD